jgi:hypothetical protein
MNALADILYGPNIWELMFVALTAGAIAWLWKHPN